MAKFVEPKSLNPIIIFEDENFRIVKRRTQIQTGEWNKELIIEAFSGTDALGNIYWRELSGIFLKKFIGRKPLHKIDWPLVKKIATIICDEKEKDDYDYIYYLNKGRYCTKGRFEGEKGEE